MSSLSNFYNNLSSNGVFFFWIVVFLFVVLIFLLVLLLNKNKKLQKLVEEEKEQPIKEENISKVEVKEESLPIEESPLFKEEPVEEIKLEIEDKPVEIKEEIIEKPKVEEKKEEIVKPTGPYQRNILKEINARTQTSPIHIDRDEYYSKKEDNSKLERNAFLEEENLSPLVELEDKFQANEDMEMLVKMMEEDVKPSNIELTDYEKKQEEEAIISYDELLKVKDKIYNITEDEETDEFLDELKSFRLDLQ